MELGSAMDLTEEEWESGPTVEDIISSVMKTESKFGKKKLSLPTLNRPSRKFNRNLQALEECCPSKNNSASAHITSDNIEPTKAHTEEYKSLMQPFNGQLSNTNTGSLSDFMETSSSGYVTQLVKTDISTFSQNGFASGSQSANKITRSISTPDMSSKQQQVYKPGSKVKSEATTEPPASRQKLFDEEVFSKRKKEEKENTSPQISLLEQTYEVKPENENPNSCPPGTEGSVKSQSSSNDPHTCRPHSQPERRRESRKQSSPPYTTTAVSNIQLTPPSFNRDDKASNTSKNCAKSTHTPTTIMSSEAVKRNIAAISQESSSRRVVTPLVAKHHPISASASKSAAIGSQITTDSVASSHTVHPAKTVVSDIKNVVAVSASTPPISANLEAMDHISVSNQNYIKLSVLGKGGSSKVYEVLDLESKIVKAIKVVDLEGIDEATLNGYKNEIGLLERLKWTDRVVRLYDYEQNPKTLKIVMERGNRDLSSILSNARGKKAAPISPFTIQHYWHGMLLACQAIHKEGIVHSDLKPANFLLVNEMVKLIDFGIASSIQDDMTSVIKDSQSGTFNYMSPESLNDVHHGPIINGLAGNKPIIKIGIKSDVWSLGCILYNLVYGRTPFQHLTNPLQKLAAISDHKTKISFPDIADKKLLDVIKQCLQFEPRNRPSIEELLRHPYLSSGALAQLKSPPKPEALSTTQREAMQNLVALSPNSLMKITSMMQKMKDSHKTGD